MATEVTPVLVGPFMASGIIHHDCSTHGGGKNQPGQGFNSSQRQEGAMDVRDALEDDAGTLAAMTGSPSDVMRNLIHHRSVRVAEADGDIIGFVSFDAEQRTVYVTQLSGETKVAKRLLDEPLRFASKEQMTVELLVPEDEAPILDAADSVGFNRIGTGPRFGSTPTVRLRKEP